MLATTNGGVTEACSKMRQVSMMLASVREMLRLGLGRAGFSRPTEVGREFITITERRAELWIQVVFRNAIQEIGFCSSVVKIYIIDHQQKVFLIIRS